MSVTNLLLGAAVILLFLEMLRSHFPALTKKDLKKLENKIMASQKELADGLLAVAEQQKKTRGEIQTVQKEVTTLKERIVELEALITAGGPVSAELQAAFDAVKEQAQIVDDEIPDVPTVPVPEV